MDKVINAFKVALDKLGFLTYDQKMSITNVMVFLFSSIVAYRTLFAGMTISYPPHVTWTVQNIDVASSLGFLYSLLNYNEKRKAVNAAQAADSTAVSPDVKK